MPGDKELSPAMQKFLFEHFKDEYIFDSIVCDPETQIFIGKSAALTAELKKRNIA